MAREALAHAVSARRTRGRASRYCEGHLHRINETERGARSPRRSTKFTDGDRVSKPPSSGRTGGPFLGLMRTFIYGLEDVDRGTDALKQARARLHARRSKVRSPLSQRGEAFATGALNGGAGQRCWRARRATASPSAVPVLSFGDAARSLRLAQRSLGQVEERLAGLAGSKEQPGPKLIESLIEALGWP